MSGESKALVRADGAGPLALQSVESGRIFVRHKWTWGIVAIAATSISVTLFGLGLLLLTGGVVGLAAGLATWAAAAGALSRTFFIGNKSLRRTLEASLGGQGEFVGVARPENNNVAFARLDTDDAVGFLELSPAEVRVRLELGDISVAVADVRSISKERCRALPLLHFVRIDTLDGQAILVMSREANSIPGAKRANEALYERLVEWHFAHVQPDT